MSNIVAIAKTDNIQYPCNKNVVEKAFELMGWDKDNIGKTLWNPLGEFIHTGNSVLIKPNLVLHYNQNPKADMSSLITQCSVVEAVLDYVIVALDGKGKITIGDAPIQACNFERLVKENGYLELVKRYKEKLVGTDVKLELIDFRELRSTVINTIIHADTKEYIYSGIGGAVVSLGEESEFNGLSDYELENIRITDYDPAILKKHHNREVNEYKVAKEILNADVVINMPKPKTHQFAGVTISMKNLVGINSRKEYLPHHTNGSKSEGGDAYNHRSILKSYNNKNLDKRNYLAQTARNYKKAWFYNQISRVLGLVIKKIYKEKETLGQWYGNDTISRTITDLNKIILYADKIGIMQDKPQRKVIVVADMIVAGEGRGPMAPTAKPCGIIAVGDDTLIFDQVLSSLMGLKFEYNNTINRAVSSGSKYKLKLNGIQPLIKSNDEALDGKEISELTEENFLYFVSPPGWKSAFITK